LNIVQLYKKDMNIYGDTGNVAALAYRARARGIEVKTSQWEIGEARPASIDILVGGGGQDSSQLVVADDLQKKSSALLAMRDDGVAMLLICGLYQLFGHRFITQEGDHIPGIGLFDLETKGSSERLIGNVVVTSQFGTLVGFENHSGKTYLGDNTASLGDVIVGGGNNGQMGDEGAIVQNCYGTYMHGPLLPKNPVLADHLLLKALQRKYGTSSLHSIDDTDELRAAEVATKLPR
jgi:CobQ-like glutamine amidotransferase family enzyme